ncbi:MAG TPA: MupA/Atu3671 family FMN-dependent luciferase-like monooxygenase [Pyrinomonadaceae bacterium]|nr:MupA/Atu3671 family FMN-dependent luciferase-like monooxygenase [Pyrinomonadaceae bacterium]
MKNVADVYRLTPVQREVLKETRTVVQVRWHLRSELDSNAFERAWEQLLARYTILRTCFLSQQLNEPVQVVRQQVKLNYQRYDWTADTPEQQQAKLQELLRADQEQGFDPARAPLFRVLEVRLAARSFELILSHHPVLLDEQSVNAMLDEVMACYDAAVENSECPLASAAPYRDYVAWVERQDLTGAEFFWRNAFDSLSLRSYHDGSRTTASQHLNFPAAETEDLKAFAKNAGLSFETLIAGAWALVLMRERNCNGVSIGVAARKRPSAESQQMIGLLANVLPLPLAFTSEQSVSSWLQEVERKIATLQRYPHVSRSQIRQWIDLEREAPLFDSVVTFREISTGCGGDILGAPVVEFQSGRQPYSLEAVVGDELSLELHAESDDANRLIENLQSTLNALTFPTLYVSTNGAAAHVEPPPQPEPQLEFSLFYFADDNAVYGSDKYRLYREGAMFADRHRLTAVWTPERHFHEKAGLYPNPSVLSAALATITRYVQLRAGSVVLPLHNSLRVAEEWSVVDNLSNGRVGVSFTSGWMPNDFAFFPERYPVKREEMFRGIQEVQDLWRGKPIPGRDGVGKDIELRIFPKPINSELPIWLTCSGGPEMFEKAGELGCHVLTALLTQSIEEVTPKIKLYRDSLVRHGHDPADRKVTMMMHTFIGEDEEAVLQKVRVPLTNYLKSHLNLIETGAQSLNLQVNIGEHEDPEKYRDQLAGFAFERYYRTSSLIGTPRSCMKMVERLKEIGVDEVACLIDFGIDVDSVLESLDHLVVLRDLSNSRQRESLLASTAAYV